MLADEEVAVVERHGADPDKDFIRPGCWLGNFLDLNSVVFFSIPLSLCRQSFQRL